MGGRVRRVATLGALATAGVVVALTGPSAAGAQEDTRKVDLDVAYQCARPTDRTWPVTLHVTATFPAAARAGEQLRPTDVALSLSVPPEALAQLSSAGATAATASVKLTTSIVQGATAATATWGATQDEKVTLVADGPTVFTGASQPEPVTVGAGGDVSFAAADLTATLTGWTADGAATEPPNVNLSCVPDGDAALAVVRVSDVDAPSTEVPPGVKVGTPDAPSANALADVPKDCHHIDPAPGATRPQDYCANLGGYTNVKRLGVSMLQPPGLVNINAGSFTRPCDNIAQKNCSENAVLPNLNGQAVLPVATGTFFTFGVIPTTGSMQLVQQDPGQVHIWFQGSAGEVTAKLKVKVHLIGATVNISKDGRGVALPLGPDCETAEPIDVTLKATPATYSITNGGVLTGWIKIPPFTGCGETEDLDPFITQLISTEDPVNFVKMTQGKVCSLGNGVNCPPPVPVPQR
jgi:uncharacterized protein DUF6801